MGDKTNNRLAIIHRPAYFLPGFLQLRLPGGLWVTLSDAEAEQLGKNLMDMAAEPTLDELSLSIKVYRIDQITEKEKRNVKD